MRNGGDNHQRSSQQLLRQPAAMCPSRIHLLSSPAETRESASGAPEQASECVVEQASECVVEHASECVDFRTQNFEPLGRRRCPRGKPPPVASRRDNPRRATAFQVDTANISRHPHRGPWQETQKRKGSRAWTMSAGCDKHRNSGKGLPGRYRR